MRARTVIAVALGVVLMAPAPGRTQEIDMMQLTCTDFAKSSRETATNIMHWLSGYFTYEDDPPVINISRIANKENQLKQYCADNPLLPLLDASAIFMDKKYNKEK